VIRYDHFFNYQDKRLHTGKKNTFRTTKRVARDWDEGGKRKEDEQPALHDVGGSF
jgi:hypothetical protein